MSPPAAAQRQRSSVWDSSRFALRVVQGHTVQRSNNCSAQRWLLRVPHVAMVPQDVPSGRRSGRDSKDSDGTAGPHQAVVSSAGKVVQLQHDMMNTTPACMQHAS